MKKILIKKPANETLAAQLVSLYTAFKNHGAADGLEFDLSAMDWAFPLLLLPITAYINSTDSSFITSNKLASYLDNIGFPRGMDAISEIEKLMRKNKTYIPISILKKEAGNARERLESAFSELVYQTIQISVSGAQDAIYYPISELVTNIFDHSKQNIGFIFGQYYPFKKHLDICIVDRGRGLSASYLEEKGLKLSDAEAIKHVMEGDSTLISARQKQQLVSLPKFHWQGVIVSYRIPVPSQPIDIYPYLE